MKFETEYYSNGQYRDGFFSECKVCVCLRVRQREQRLRKESPKWVEMEQIRCRKKYHRLNYRVKYRSRDTEKQLQKARRYRKTFPDKVKAVSAVSHAIAIGILGRLPGMQYHHWSYSEQHRIDVIPPSIKKHAKAHRFLVYDDNEMLFRTLGGALLDTKESHIRHIEYSIRHGTD